jgi:hypothetical protein
MSRILTTILRWLTVVLILRVLVVILASPPDGLHQCLIQRTPDAAKTSWSPSISRETGPRRTPPPLPTGGPGGDGGNGNGGGMYVAGGRPGTGVKATKKHRNKASDLALLTRLGRA